MKKEILFGYRLSNADCCEYGDDDGFSIIIYKDGTAMYTTYIVSDIINKCKKFRISNETVTEIRSNIDKNKKKISALNKDIDNGSCDGVFNIFIFGKKKISALNIEEHNIKTLSLINPKYYIEYHSVIIQENIIIKIFKEICSILRKNHAIRLDLNSIKIPLWLFINRLK